VSLEAEIANEIASAGMQRFRPETRAFCASVEPGFENAVVSRELVQPPLRNPGVIGLVHLRAQFILEAIRSGAPLPPIEVDAAPDLPEPYRYRVRDGFHRFHLSGALGYTHLPVVIKPYFNLNAL
jgi:hypothetical protein